MNKFFEEEDIDELVVKGHNYISRYALDIIDDFHCKGKTSIDFHFYEFLDLLDVVENEKQFQINEDRYQKLVFKLYSKVYSECTEYNTKYVTVESGTPDNTNVIIVRGMDGKDGKDGESIIGPQGLNNYELWLSLGNTGTLEDYLESLKGGNGTLGIGNYTASSDGVTLQYSWEHGVDLFEIDLDAVVVSVEAKSADANGLFSMNFDDIKIYINYQIGRKIGTNNLTWSWLIAKNGASPIITGAANSFNPDFDDLPTLNSQKLVRSGGIYNALANKIDAIAGYGLISDEERDIINNLYLPDKGEFLSEAALISKWPTPIDGWKAVVRDVDDNKRYRYLVNEDSEWFNDGEIISGSGGGASNFAELNGLPDDNPALKSALLAKQSEAQVLAIVKQFAIHTPSTGVIWFDKNRTYGTTLAPVTGNIISNHTTPIPIVNASGEIVHNTLGVYPELPTNWVKIYGDFVLNTINRINYRYLSTSRIEYSVYQ